MLGKAFPYPADAGFGALPVVLAGRSRGMEPAGPTGRAAACSCSVQGVATPPPRSPLFAFSGATCAGSRSSGLRQQGRAGQLQRRSRERPQVLDVQAKAVQGSRWALESRLMLSPLPVVVTAQKPAGLPTSRGFVLGSTKSVPQSYPTAAAM